MKVGIDIVDIDRFIDLKCKDKIFTLGELNYSDKFKNPEEHLAGFFAAKEAFYKAMGSGINRKDSLLEIEVIHNKKGAPFLNVTGKSKSLLNDRAVEISISQTKCIATAICIIK